MNEIEANATKYAHFVVGVLNIPVEGSEYVVMIASTPTPRNNLDAVAHYIKAHYEAVEAEFDADAQSMLWCFVNRIRSRIEDALD